MNKNPLYVKVRCKNQFFYIYTDEYSLAGHIKDEVARIKKIPKEDIKIYYPNKRVIEDYVTNHDQQIYHNQLLYAVFKDAETGTFEHINEIINYQQ
jgi:hypothetical protein